MAAHSHSGTNSTIRVRLYFDYPPPAVVDSRMCWLLVDLNTCRVVADLESIIKERFEFSRGSILNLYVEDCYLPHTESIYVVRDNDGVRVKVLCLPQVNGHDGCSDTPSKSRRKRQRLAEEGEPGEDGASRERKKSKREKSEVLEEDAEEASDGQRKEKQRKKKKKREKAERVAPTPKPAASKPAASKPKPAASKPKPAASTPKPAASTKKTLTSTENPVRPTAIKATTQNKSSSDFSSTLKVPPKNKPLTSASPKGRTKGVSQSQEAPPHLQSTNHLPSQTVTTAVTPRVKSGQPSSSDSTEEMEPVNQAQSAQPGSGPAPQWSGSGYGRKTRHGGAEERGSESLFEFSSNGAKEPSYHTDSLTNTSVVLQNGAQSVPTQDYSSMPLLAAPPQVGQKIAFKLLELTENYTPEVSEYKEGRILSFDPTTKQIELELLHVSEAPTEPGKFDLVYQNADGTERVEYAVSRCAWVTERWDSLLEPRLVL